MEINLNQDLCYQEIFLLKDNNIYKITINKNDEIITFKCRNYMIDINFNDLYANKFDSIDDAYEFVISIFEQNNAFIKDIIVNKELKLVFKINEEKEFEILLLYNKINNDLVINQINKLNEEINDLKNENYKLRQEIECLKKYHYKTNPKEIQLLTDITKDSYSCTNLDNTYNIFKSINNKFYLIYATENKSLICYDLNEQNIIKELKNYHSEYITNDII